MKLFFTAVVLIFMLDVKCKTPQRFKGGSEKWRNHDHKNFKLLRKSCDINVRQKKKKENKC